MQSVQNFLFSEPNKVHILNIVTPFQLQVQMRLTLISINIKSEHSPAEQGYKFTKACNDALTTFWYRINMKCF